METFKVKLIQDEYFVEDTTNKNNVKILMLKGEKGDPGSGTDVSWGDIEGTLSNQTDLKNVLDSKANTSDIPDSLSDLSDDTTHRLVSDTEKTTWNNKSDFSGNYNDLTNKPTIPSKTSDITNDSGYITNSVNNLTNYTKTTDLQPHIVNVGTSVDGNYRTNILYTHNLFNKNDFPVLNATVPSNSSAIGQADMNRTTYIPCKPNTTYTIQKRNDGDTNRFVVAYTTIIPNINIMTYGNVANNSAGSLTITTGNDAKYLVVFFYRTNETTLTYQQVIDSLQIEEGSTATTYEDYIIPSINIDGEEIYSKPVVLWTNPSLSSTFANQQITLNDDITNYKYYEIKYVFATSETNYELSTGKIDINKYAFLQIVSTSGGVLCAYRRLIEAIGTNTITIGGGSKMTATGTETYNNACIPYQIIGYK